ncbi:MAG: hypothetical protein GC186_08035 [Rhodobacteraceae bacterium]|nr:hypothetical protein [Paracoccaceae bacterium]
MIQPAKIKLKVGSIELEYEGDPAFLKEGLESLLVTMTDLAKIAPSEEPAMEQEQEATVPREKTVKPPNGHQLSTSTLAAHLGAKTCPELVVCALANLELIQGKSGAVRKEISDQMKSATAYYKSSMQGGNLTTALSNLTKAKRINDIGSGRFSLNATERTSLEAKIAAI